MQLNNRISYPGVPTWLSELSPDFEYYQKEFYRSMLERLRNNNVVVLRGTGRSGKTATAFVLIEKAVESGIQAFQLGGRDISRELPFKIQHIEELDQIPSDDQEKIVVADDVAMMGISGRNFSSKPAKEFQSQVTVLSHKSTSLVMTIQSLRILDVYGVMSSQNTNLLIKYSSGWNMALERSGAVSDVIAMFNNYLKYICENTVGYPDTSKNHPAKGLTYDCAKNLVGYNYLPDWWNNKISKVWQ